LGRRANERISTLKLSPGDSDIKANADPEGIGDMALQDSPGFPGQDSGPVTVRVSEIISALSFALDLTEGQPVGHSVQSCMIGMRIARQLGMPPDQQADLYYALLLKDAGCSSNASRLFHIIHSDEIQAKGDLKTKDWTRVGWESLHYAVTHVATGAPFLERVQTLLRVAAKQQQESCELVKIRCERGSSIARRMGFPEPVAAAIRSLDEHWNGGGYPDGLRGRAIPMFSRIMNLSQTLAVFLVRQGPDAAIQAAVKRAGRWFDPELVKAALALEKTGVLWTYLDSPNLLLEVSALEPEDRRLVLGEKELDSICLAFAEVIDAKSPFTYTHSTGVAKAAVAIAEQLELNQTEIAFLRRAALLHDIGKLSVPNAILEKPGKLTDVEWEVVKQHPYYTLEILRKIPGFDVLSDVAAAHHEKLDGTGYFRHWGADQLSLPARILVVADIFDALSAARPYRDALPLEKVFAIMEKDAPRALDARCLEALELATQDVGTAVTALSAGVGISPEPLVPTGEVTK
jgi:putative nucleotidyltransferase with HDIG domain